MPYRRLLIVRVITRSVLHHAVWKVYCEKRRSHKMLTLYFSGTGNTKYVAELFSRKMSARCFSVEDDADFSVEIKAHETIAFCYPIYGSRVPLIMRLFTHKHMLTQPLSQLLTLKCLGSYLLSLMYCNSQLQANPLWKCVNL